MRPAKTMRAALPISSALALLLSGCSMAPHYAPPQTATPAQYKEMPESGNAATPLGGWTSATPLDASPRGAWWTIFGDEMLNALEMRAQGASPSLAAALARYDQARAVVRIEGADLLPQVDAGADATRTRLSAGRPQSSGSPVTYNDYSVGASLSYEIDLWGRIRNSVKAARSEAQASAADLALARLSLQASVADAYFRLRGLDAQAELLRQTVDAFGRAYDLTAKRHDGGIASGLDVNRAKSVLSDARAQISAIANERAATEHELAALVGALASDFAIAPVAAQMNPPIVTAGAPSELLQRRPDVAAAERRMAAANARIGIAKAAFFPSLTLGIDGGYRTGHGALFESPNSYWGLGPLSALVTLFDAGRRNAQVKLSRGEYDEVAADYRNTVLTAFRQVEDSLAATRTLAAQAVDQREAAVAASRTSDLALTRYHDGASDYLDVVTAQTTALDAQRATIALQTQRMRAAIALIRAMGGGYESVAKAAAKPVSG